MPKEKQNLVVALDIGTSKVACLVAELGADGSLEILGMGSHPSRGLKKGVVVNIEATVAAIQRALEEAELMADCKIASAYVGIAGSHIRSFNSTGMVAVKDREVGALDVDRALETARAVSIARSTSSTPTSRSLTATMPVELKLRMWLPAMPT